MKWFGVITAATLMSLIAAIVVGLVVTQEPDQPASTSLVPSVATDRPTPSTSEARDLAKLELADKALFVDARTGDDSNVGTVDAPLRRPRQAFEVVQPGTTIYLRSGTYDDRELDNNILRRSGTPDAWIDIRPFPGEQVTIVAGGEWGNGFELQGASYVRISGFVIRGRQDSIHGSGVFGKDNSHTIEVIGNDIEGFGGAGVSFVQSAKVTIENNAVRNSAHRSYFQGSGINLFEATGPVADEGFSNTVRNNYVAGNHNGVTDEYGKLTDGNCIIIDFFNETDYQGSTLVENNVCVENGGRGVHVFNSSNVLARHNTLIGNVRSVDLHGGPAELVAADASNVIFANNLVLNREEVVPAIVENATDVSFIGNSVLVGEPPEGVGNIVVPSFDPVVDFLAAPQRLELLVPPEQSVVTGAADPDYQPELDALGTVRSSPATVGALEADQ